MLLKDLLDLDNTIKSVLWESINGNESVDDLLAMVNRQDDPSGVIALICLTTAMTNPATFRQFSTKNPKITSRDI